MMNNMSENLTKNNEKASLFVSKIERKSMKTVAAVTLAAKIDKPVASVPQFSSKIRFFTEFGIPGGTRVHPKCLKNGPRGTRNSSRDPSWSLPGTISASRGPMFI